MADLGRKIDVSVLLRHYPKALNDSCVHPARDRQSVRGRLDVGEKCTHCEVRSSFFTLGNSSGSSSESLPNSSSSRASSKTLSFAFATAAFLSAPSIFNSL